MLGFLNHSSMLCSSRWAACTSSSVAAMSGKHRQSRCCCKANFGRQGRCNSPALGCWAWDVQAPPGSHPHQDTPGLAAGPGRTSRYRDADKPRIKMQCRTSTPDIGLVLWCLSAAEHTLLTCMSPLRETPLRYQARCGLMHSASRPRRTSSPPSKHRAAGTASSPARRARCGGLCTTARQRR
jgi:hypothetical protein